MKRTLVLVLFALLGITAANAQQQFAMLNHNDTLIPFYGSSAFANAHGAASDGDVITLSAGVFEDVELTKLVTITGAGMENDTALNSQATVITGDLVLNANGNDSLHLAISRVLFSGKVKFKASDKAQFTLCRFMGGIASWDNSGDGCSLRNAQFSFCVFHGDVNTYYFRESSEFFNCVLLSAFTVDDRGEQRSVILDHCIIPLRSGSPSRYFIATNCVLIGDCDYDHWIGNNATTVNCIGINSNSGEYSFFDNNDINGNINKNSYAEVFKEFSGTYRPGASFELVDSLQSTGIGIDMEMKRLISQNFYKISVGKMSTPDGKLNIEIKPINEE